MDKTKNLYGRTSCLGVRMMMIILALSVSVFMAEAKRVTLPGVGSYSGKTSGQVPNGKGKMTYLN